MDELKEAKDSVKDIFNNLFKNIKERSGSPFVFSFIIAFIAYNWKPISIVLKSESKIEETILYIKNLQYEHIDGYIIYPFQIALIYAFGIPLLDVLRSIVLGVYKSIQDLVLSSFELYYYEKKIKLENRKSDYENKSELNEKIESLQEQLNEELKKLDKFKSENKNLTLELDRSKNLIQLNEKTIDETHDEITQLSAELLKKTKENEKLKNSFTKELIKFESMESLLVQKRTDLDKLQTEYQNYITKKTKEIQELQEKYAFDKSKTSATITVLNNKVEQIGELEKEAEENYVKLTQLKHNISQLEQKLLEYDEFSDEELKEFSLDYFEIAKDNKFIKEFIGLVNEINYPRLPENYKNISKIKNNDLFTSFILEGRTMYKLSKKGLYFWHRISNTNKTS
ncbi:hypothetical protein [Flavicella sediminum]|uniref:hypothetical protein n=1 Tax=Flavicella sediminum TaxID=2585141 RepID=UPI00112431A3|nr:hypothetical protein [Flavicella sediminum]